MNISSQNFILLNLHRTWSPGRYNGWELYTRWVGDELNSTTLNAFFLFPIPSHPALGFLMLFNAQFPLAPSMPSDSLDVSA